MGHRSLDSWGSRAWAARGLARMTNGTVGTISAPGGPRLHRPTPTLYEAAAGSKGAGAHFTKAGRVGRWTRRVWSPKLEVGIRCGERSVTVTATSWHICLCSFNTQNIPMKRYCYFILQKKKETTNGWHLVTQLVRSRANTQTRISLALTIYLPCLHLQNPFLIYDFQENKYEHQYLSPWSKPTPQGLAELGWSHLLMTVQRPLPCSLFCQNKLRGGFIGNGSSQTSIKWFLAKQVRVGPDLVECIVG